MNKLIKYQKRYKTLSQQGLKFVRVLTTTSRLAIGNLQFAIGKVWSSKLLISLITICYLLITPLAMMHASSLAEGYPTSQNLIEGTLVTLSNETPPQVNLANLNNSQYLVGVIEDDGEGLITLNKDGATILVATSGEVLAFVSDLSGEIKPGDFIGTSWINGVGMKAERITEQKLLGVALEPFNDETTEFIEVEQVETNDGNKTARIGKIAVRLFEREVGPDVNQGASSLENLALRLAGKDVSFARIVAAFGLFTISVIISGVFLANAIKSSLISIGRNPLSHSPIFNSLLQISGVSIALIMIGSLLAYVVLIL